LVYNPSSPDQPIAHKRMQALVASEGDLEKDNPNSAAVWHYQGSDPKEFESTMHRACGSAAIKDGLLLITDFSGLLHCLDAKSGKAHWTYDMFAACWATPLILGDKVYVGDEDGDIAIVQLSDQFNLISETNMSSAVYSTPTAANKTLFISTRNQLFAIEQGAQAAGK
jgi:outer membrane protein assembly factor BamB